MFSTKTFAGVSAGAVVMATLAAAPASAAPYMTYGAGSSLAAPYVRQAGDCYSVKTPLVFAGNPPTTQTLRDFNYTGSPAQNCATKDYVANYQVNYISTGSGTGIKGIFSHDPAQIGDTSPAEGTQLYPTFNFAFSDTSLGATEVGYYNNGNVGVTGGGAAGVTVVAPGATPDSGQYKNPKKAYGALVQFPVLVAPVAIAFDPVYRKVRNANGSITSYSFNLAYKRADGSGGLHLTTDLVCAIFNGSITNWNDARLTAANNNVSLKATADTATFSVPLQIVGREDSSGTTSIWTRWLAKNCENVSGNSYSDSTTRIPGTYVDSTGTTRTTTTGNKDLAGALYLKANANTAPSGERVGTYTLANGNDGVAKYLDFTRIPNISAGQTVVQGRIGYVGPDYTLPAVLFTGANTYNLVTADVQNKAGKFVAPTANGALIAFGTLLPPDTSVSGKYSATVDGSARSRKNPQDWVEPAKKTSALAVPTAQTAYPIVGTTNFLGYTCYKTVAVKTSVQKFDFFFTNSPTINDPSLGLLAKSGFSPLPAVWQKAIKDTFLDNTDPNDLKLDIESVASGATQCKAVTGA